MSYELCKECGERNPIYAKYCQDCGKLLNNNSKYDINNVQNIVSIINLDVQKAENHKKGKVKYFFENEELFVEELAMKYYENIGYKALWTENYYWWFLMALIFWDEIFAPINGVFNPMPLYSRMNDIPNDFFKPEFYQKRKSLINNKLIRLQNADLSLEISNSYQKNYGKCCRPIEDWDRYNLSELIIPSKVMDKNSFLEILTRLITNFIAKRSGLPDLIVFNKDILFFSEVKSEKDRISDNQREWHKFLSQLNLKVDLFLVNHSERKINNIVSSYPISNKEFKPNGTLNDFRLDLEILEKFAQEITEMVNRAISLPDDENIDSKLNFELKKIQDEIKKRKEEINSKLTVLNSDLILIDLKKDKDNPYSFTFITNVDEVELNKYVEFYKNQNE